MPERRIGDWVLGKEGVPVVETLAVDALFYVRRARGLASACGWFSIQAIEFSPVEPAAMPLFARKKKEPKEELRNSQREVNRSTRALDSDIRDLEREEASLIVKLKRKESLSKNEVRWSGGGGGGGGGGGWGGGGGGRSCSWGVGLGSVGYADQAACCQPGACAQEHRRSEEEKGTAARAEHADGDYARVDEIGPGTYVDRAGAGEGETVCVAFCGRACRPSPRPRRPPLRL